MELMDLARARFTDLTESELKVLVAVTTGEFAVCGPSNDDSDPGNNPESASSWSTQREVRAELIQWLCIDRGAAAWVDRRGVQIHAARISGELDLSFAVVRFPLTLLRCRIADEMNLRYAQFEILVLSGSFVRGFAADGMRVRGSLNLRDGFRADGEVCLLGADIGGDLVCDNGKFLNYTGCALNADGLKVGGGVFLRNGFRAEGEVRLLGSNIGGNLECNNGKFVKPFSGNALFADRAKVGGDVFLDNGFSAEGEVRLLGADIRGNLSCVGGTLVNHGGYVLNADGAQVGGNVFLREFNAEGAVRLLGADIGGDLEISRAKFAIGSSVVAERANVKGGFFWRDLGPNAKAVLNLSHASVGQIFDDRDSWPAQGNLDLDGFEYTRIGPGPTDAETRLDWLARQPPKSFRPQPYQQLAKVLREAGDRAGARQVLIAMEDSRREHGNPNWRSRVWSRVLRGTIRYGYKPGRALWIGLGIVAIATVFFFFGSHDGAITPTDKDAYRVFETNYPKEEHASAYYPEFYSPIYALDTFLPIINLGQKEHWMPNTNHGSTIICGRVTTGLLLRYYLWIHIAAGWVLTTLFVAGFSSVVRNE